MIWWSYVGERKLLPTRVAKPVKIHRSQTFRICDMDIGWEFGFAKKFPSSSREVFEQSREAKLGEKRGSARGNETRS